MKKILKILIGLVLLTGTIALVFPGMAMQSWGYAALNLIKGGVTLLVLLAGMVLITLGITELKE
jgi:hypothetical protein